MQKKEEEKEIMPGQFRAGGKQLTANVDPVISRLDTLGSRLSQLIDEDIREIKNSLTVIERKLSGD